MRPLVSTIIATYNRRSMLPRAMRSVLAQSMRNLELIVVDDGSADGTDSVVAVFEDSRLRYVRHPSNRGLPAARNSGIRAARGRYIAFLDDDDQWVPEKLERQLKALADADAVLCAARLSDGRIRRFDKTAVAPADLRRGNPFDPSGLIVSAELLRAVAFDETLRAGEDWDAFIRLAQRGRIAYLPEPLVMYDASPAGRMTTEAREMSIGELERRMAVLHKHRAFLGPFWFKYHVATFLLSNFRGRGGRLARLTYAAQRCGLWPVARVLLDRTRKAVAGAG